MKKTASRTIVKDAPEQIATQPAKKPRKRAEDLIEAAPAPSLEETPATESVSTAKPVKVTKSKKTTSVTPTESDATTTKSTPTRTSSRNKKAAAPVETKAAVVEAEANNDAEVEEEELDDTLDDQTAALLAGFESSEDENDPEDDGVALDKVPSLPNEKALRKQIKAAEADDEENTPGVVYVGYVLSLFI